MPKHFRYDVNTLLAACHVQANLHPPNKRATDEVLADGQPVDDEAIERLLPIAKACKLVAKEQRPKDARDPRRANRVLHLCQACYAYKQPAEFYLCCLHDAMRCCRECMLVRAGAAHAPFVYSRAAAPPLRSPHSLPD